MTMWRCHLRYPLIALALGLALTALPWVGTAAPAKRPMSPTPSVPPPTDAEQALALFKAKVEQFQRFLAQEPLALIRQDYRFAPTNDLYEHMRFKILESSFDVQRSDSLVSPFIGYLNLTYVKETNGACGDLVSSDRKSVGYSTYDKAMAHVRDCFQRSRFGVENVRLTFAYQDGRWVFKDAIRTKYNDKDSILLAALGRPEPPWHRLADNQAWEALVK